MVLGRGVKIDEEKMTLNANRVLSMMTEARRVERHVSTPEHLLSNCLLVANVLEQIRNMDNGEDVLDCFEGMQLLTIAGMLDEQESFYDTCGAVSVEALQALQAR